MSAPVPAPVPISVRGGADGVDARFEDLLEVAGTFARAAEDAGASAAALQGCLVNVTALSTAVVDPVGAARFEEELGLALDGPHGLLALTAACVLMAAAVRAAAAAYRAVDHLETAAHTVLDAVVDIPRAEVGAVQTVLRTHSVVRAVNDFATEDPALCGLVATGALALVAANPLMGLLLDDGHPRVRDLGMADAPTGAAPKTLADVVSGLATRDAGPGGEVDVRFVYRADGSRAVIVDIPGTKSWSPLPTSDVTSLATNVHAMAGQPTSYSRGVLAAMQRAGVRPDDPVMLVGHSEGGMVAARVAIDANASKQFHVTHVVTAGSPIGRFAADVPRNVQVLAIENKHDIVPSLDGAANAPRPNVTTATVDHDVHDVLGDHDIEGSYVPGARDVQASADPSARSFVAGAQQYFDGTGVQTHRFRITRAY